MVLPSGFTDCFRMWFNNAFTRVFLYQQQPPDVWNCYSSRDHQIDFYSLLNTLSYKIVNDLSYSFALNNIRHEFKSIDKVFDFKSEGLTLKLESAFE